MHFKSYVIVCNATTSFHHHARFSGEMADRPAFFNIYPGKTFMSLFLKNKQTNKQKRQNNLILSFNSLADCFKQYTPRSCFILVIRSSRFSNACEYTYSSKHQVALFVITYIVSCSKCSRFFPMFSKNVALKSFSNTVSSCSR